MEQISHRVVLFHEVEPGHWVQVTVRGDFDSDIYNALEGFLQRKATRPVPVQDARPRHISISAGGCPCKGHPFNCYEHPNNCGCSPPSATANETISNRGESK